MTAQSEHRANLIAATPLKRPRRRVVISFGNRVVPGAGSELAAGGFLAKPLLSGRVWVHREQLPLAGYALQADCSALPEPEARARHEIVNGA
jgi:hypothetical protein